MQSSNWRERLAQTKHTNYFFLIALYAFLQILLLLIAHPNHNYSNVGWYYDIAYHLRDVGVFTLWTPYPPLFAFFFYVFGLLFSDRESFSLAWQILNLVLVLASGGFVYLIAQPFGKSTARLAALGYGLINLCIASGIATGIYNDQYDYLPILMMLGCLWLLIDDKPTASAALCAIGAMTKLFPALVLPIALLAFDNNRRRVIYVAVFAATCVLVVLPWLIINPGSLISFSQFSASREAWETVWIFPVMKFPPIPNPKSFITPFSSNLTLYSWLTALTAVAMLASLWVHRQIKSRRDMARAFLSLLLVLIIFSRGVSSYYIFWIFPLFFAIYKPAYAFLICAALTLVGNFEFFGAPPIQTIPYWVAIFGRHALLIGLWMLSMFEKPLRMRFNIASDSA